MYFDLNVSLPTPASLNQTRSSTSKKLKGKQPEQVQTTLFSPTQITRIEARIDLLVRLGYTVLGLNQVVETKIDPKTHTNVLDPLLTQLRKRAGVLYLKRLTIVLNESSEKGNGLTTSNASLFTSYDILALQPTTANTFSTACLSHTAPSTLTVHIISLPLSAPRLPFRLKHTLIRTAFKNGCAFEIDYSGALSNADDARRNWWSAARELVRVSKGKGLIVSGGTEVDTNLRAPRDAGNLITLLELPQNLAHNASTTTPKSLVLRAQTRKTYRAILSKPELILPPGLETAKEVIDSTSPDNLQQTGKSPSEDQFKGKKRTREEQSLKSGDIPLSDLAIPSDMPDGDRKKKKKKNKGLQG